MPYLFYNIQYHMKVKQKKYSKGVPPGLYIISSLW